LVIALAITACGPVSPPPVSGKQSALDDFMYALRWQRYEEAAAFFTGAHRRAFLDQFDALSKDLTVTDVRMKRIQQGDGGRSAEAVLEMDYQLLPSASLKTLRIDQTWLYVESGDAKQSGFMITTPFPKFPEETSRNKSRKGTLPP
jgi:hypothetical protein